MWRGQQESQGRCLGWWPCPRGHLPILWELTCPSDLPCPTQGHRDPEVLINCERKEKSSICSI